MKVSLLLDLASVFGPAISVPEPEPMPYIRLAHAETRCYSNAAGKAFLQSFDGLLAYLNLLDLQTDAPQSIPMTVSRADLHIVYFLKGRSNLVIRDLRDQQTYSIAVSRGRYFYLPAGDYEIQVPAGETTCLNFYFRCSIFRDGNERPFRFLHPLIDAHRQASSRSCSSIDFRAGERTILLLQTIIGNLKKGDLDSEDHIQWGVRKLITLSKEKIFEEYDKISESQRKAKAAREMIQYTVATQGQDFKIESLADKLHISVDYLHALIQEYYGQSPQEMKFSFLVELAQKYIMDGLPIDQVAYELGYSSPSSFAHFFKKRTGLSATEFYKQQTR